MAADDQQSANPATSTPIRPSMFSPALTRPVACSERVQNPSAVFPSRQQQRPVPPSRPLSGSSAPIRGYAACPPTPAEHGHLRASFSATFLRPLETVPTRLRGSMALEHRSETFVVLHSASSIPLDSHPISLD